MVRALYSQKSFTGIVSTLILANSVGLCLKAALVVSCPVVFVEISVDVELVVPSVEVCDPGD